MNSLMSLPEELSKQLNRLAQATDGILVAVSGGADSVALLRGLLIVGGARIEVAHLNHRLRGAESDDDEAFVREQCTSLGVPCHSRTLDISALAQSAGSNLEDEARRQRYQWFGELATQLGLPYVATGHTADDQAETVLFRLMRGAGLQGLRGIARSRPLARNVTLIRPLLTTTRDELREFLSDLNQPHREDRSNMDLGFSRNRIRHVVLPILKYESPSIGDHLCQVAEQATAAFSVIEADASRLLSAAELPRAGSTCILQRQKLAEAPPYLVCEVLRSLWQREGWPMGDMRQANWERAATVACSAAPAVDLPGPIRVQTVGRVVQIGPTVESRNAERRAT